MRLCVLNTGLQFKSKFGLVLYCGLTFGWSVSMAQVYKVIDDTPKLSTYPKWIYSQIKKHEGWKPSVQVQNECKLSFSSNVLNPVVCRSSYDLNHWESFLSKIYVDFDFENSRFFHRVQFEPQPGVKFRGLLGLQVDSARSKKPLMILRLGIHGNIDEFMAERFLAKIAYEDLGYNVLVLESLTSHAYLTMNERFSFGGVEEGLHTFYVLQLLAHNKLDWADRISKIYLMGVSLGGPGVFIANYLDEQSKINGVTKKSVEAIQLFCPLINFEQTFKAHSEAGLFAASVDLWNRHRLLALRLKNPDFANLQWWKTLLDLKPRFVPAVLQWLDTHEPKPILSLDLFQQQFPGLELPQDFIRHVQASQSFYGLNRFWGFYKNEQTPISIYVTPEDPAVKNYLNSDLIRTGKQPGVFKHVAFTDLEGVHCALAAEYQWPFLVEMVRRGFEKSDIK